MRTQTPNKLVAVPLAVNGALAAAKLWAATLTGSSALLADAVRSITDVSSQALMLAGLSRTRPAPGGSDIAFWTFVVAILLYALGAGVATYEGVDRLNHSHAIAHPTLAYAVLGVALAIHAGLAWAASRRPATDPVRVTLRIETTAGVLCAVLALAGLAAADLGEIPGADGAAAIAIGSGLALIAALMAIEVKTLLAVVPLAVEAASPAPELVPAPALAAPSATPDKPSAQPPPPASRKRKGKGKRRR